MYSNKNCTWGEKTEKEKKKSTFLIKQSVKNAKLLSAARQKPTFRRLALPRGSPLKTWILRRRPDPPPYG